MSKVNILVVEDQDSIRHFVVKALEDEGHAVTGVGSVREARVVVERDMPDLAFLDLKLPDGNGLELLREIKRVQPEVAVILMTAFGELDTAVEAMSAGAYWFMKKPFEQEELLALTSRALESQKMWLELRRLRNQAFSDDEFLHSSSPAMQETYAIAEQVARGDTTSVLIEGESGTGKEYFANLIHRMSARHAQAFVEINCAAIPSELLESELFGHEKGAFTDAKERRLGKLELAHGGSVFFDEIGDMPLELQVKLLRALQERSFERVGGHELIRMDVRVMAATHRDLDAMMKDGRFREDLFYRLNVVTLSLPALRDRRGDIPLLAEHFLAKYAESLGERVISAEAMDRLMGYDWPGNVRELENVVQRAMVMASTGAILPEHLPIGPVSTAAAVGTDASLEDVIERKMHECVRGLRGHAAANLHGLMVGLVEKPLLRAVMRETKGNQVRAAQLLGINRNTLRKKLKEHGIDPDAV